MIASNIICRGASRFLNKAYFQDVQIGGTATLSSLSLSGNLSVTGNTTVGGTLGVTGNATFGNITATGTVVLSRTQDVSGTANNSPALIVGGGAASPHLELDANEVQAKASGTSTGSLYLNNDGGAVYLSGGSVYASGSTFVASTGNIATLNSTNVNVTNNLRANHYDLQTVAQLGGSFYVSPTVKFPNSGTTLAVAKSGTTLTLTIKDSSITSATMAGVVWTAGSGVKVSGTINGVVTGTMDGTVSSINTSSHVLTLSVSGENSANVVAGTYTASQFKDLSVMLYTRKQDGTSKMINTASGAIASFTDGGNNVPVKQLVVDIEPVQDLHGYDSPWPAGGGKNLLQNTAVSRTVNGVTFTMYDDGTIKANGTATGGNAGIIYLNDDVKLSTGQYTVSCNNNGNYGADTGYWYLYDKTAAKDAANPNITTFTADSSHTYSFRFFIRENKTVNAIFYPMIRLSSVTDATFAPYSNICPISGHTSATVTRTGANVWDEVWESGSINIADGQNVTDANAIRSKNYIPVKPNQTYYFVASAWGNNNARVRYYGKDKAYTGNAPIVSGTAFTIPADTYFMRFSSPSALTVTTYNHDVSINYPSTDHDYHAYNGQTVTIDLDGTRYGGTLDVGTGVMTVDRGYKLLNGVATGGVAYRVNGHTANTTRAFVTITDKAYGVDNMMSSSFHVSNADAVGSMYGRATNNGVEFYLDASVPNTDAGVIAWFAENPIDFVYELATPFTVQLSKTEVRTLQGYNNIWSNTGDTNVIYESSQVDSTNNYNVGIWMNCYDQANSSSTIRVYNGSSRWPNVFLGNMTNADLPRVNGNAPYGYGLYSDNVFLRGIISATGGLIGNWTIGTTGMFYNSDAPGSTSITMIPGGTTASTTSIGGSSGSKSWIFTGKNLFGIDTTGKLYASSAEISGKIIATSGTIGGWSIDTDRLATESTNPYVLLAPGIGTNKDVFYVRTGSGTTADPYKWPIVMRADGYFYADNATIAGKITAQSGIIGGFHITSSSNQGTSSAGGHIYPNSLYRHSGDGTTYEYEFGIKGDAAENPSSSNSEYGNLAFYVKRINKGAAWNGTNTNMFYVTHKGFMYCRDAEIVGKITATSGTIGGVTANSSYGLYTNSKTSATSTNTGFLISKNGAIYLGAYNSTNGACPFQVTSDGALTATSGKIGPWNVTTTSIYKGKNALGSTTSGAAYFGDLGLSVGNKFKVDASGDGAIILGELAEGKTHVEVDSDSFDVCVGANTGSNASKIASFGENVVLGNENESQFVISSNSIRGVVGNSIDAFRFSISDAEMSSTRHWSKEVSDKDGNRNIQLNIVGLSTGAKIHFQLNATKNKQRDGTIISYDFTYGTSVDNVPFSMDNGITLQLHYNGSDLIRYNIIFNTNDETVHSLFITFTSYTYGPYFSLGTRDEDGSFGGYSCTIGYNNIAYGAYSCAIGVGTIASKSRQLAIGSYNIEDTDETNHLRFIIGNGSSSLSRSNALTVDWHGNVVASGNIACTGISAPLFVEKYFATGNLSVGANAAFSINFNQLSGYSIPSGYRAIAFSHISVNNNYLYFRWMNPVSSNNAAIAVGRNSSSSAQSFKLEVRIIFAQTSLFGT